jgi:hypothetical protein
MNPGAALHYPDLVRGVEGQREGWRCALGEANFPGVALSTFLQVAGARHPI